MASFNSLSQHLIDAWLLSDETTTPDELYASVRNKLTIKMALSVVTTEATDPYDWRFRRVRDFGFKSRLLDQMKQQFPDATLRELNRYFIDDAIISAYSRALEVKRPAIDLVRTKLLGVRIGYERLIVPQRCEGKPTWCISLVEGRFFISPMREVKTDVTDDNVIQLLIEGHATKEIAEVLNLSPRTIEHRINKLKARFEANNLVHLVAKIVATQVDRHQEERVESHLDQ
ncbi:hypothetical protein NN6n1_01460 [Shinella zoogloeoides]